jgi:hypothetical protein
MNAAFVFGIEKRIFNSAVKKSTIALTSSAHQSPVRDFDFLGCSALFTRAALLHCKTATHGLRLAAGLGRRFSASLNDPVGNTGYTSVLLVSCRG